MTVDDARAQEIDRCQEVEGKLKCFCGFPNLIAPYNINTHLDGKTHRSKRSQHFAFGLFGITLVAQHFEIKKLSTLVAQLHNIMSQWHSWPACRHPLKGAGERHQGHHD